jgi:hypothetical protein
VEKIKSITYSECVLAALVVQQAMRVRSRKLLPLGCLAVPYVSILSHKRHDFRIKDIEHRMDVLIFSVTFA